MPFMRWLRALSAAFVALHSSNAAVAGAQTTATAIRDVTVITGTDAPPIPAATVVFTDGRIVAVGPSASVSVPAGARVIDGRGKFVIPGLINTHVHVAASVADSSLNRLLGYELAYGVTGIRDASGIGRERELVALRERIQSGAVLGPRLFVSGSATPQNLPRYAAKSWLDLLQQLQAVGVDGIKLRNLTRAQADTVIRLARELKLPIFGHTYGPGFSLDNFTQESIGAGVSGVMHFAGIGPPDSPKNRALVADGWQRTWLQQDVNWLDASEEQENRLLQDFLKHGAWLEPTLTTVSFALFDERYRNKPEARLLRTPYDQVRQGFPAFATSDLELARQSFRRTQNFVHRLQAAGGMVLAGTDGLPWPGAGLHEELRLMVEGGMSPLAALQTATRNPARALGWERRTGTIAVGLDADLVVLDADPLRDITNISRIWAVVRAGQLLERAMLDRMSGVSNPAGR